MRFSSYLLETPAAPRLEPPILDLTYDPRMGNKSNYLTWTSRNQYVLSKLSHIPNLVVQEVSWNDYSTDRNDSLMEWMQFTCRVSGYTLIMEGGEQTVDDVAALLYYHSSPVAKQRVDQLILHTIKTHIGRPATRDDE